MRKLIILATVLLPLACAAQRDFDYSLFTNSTVMIKTVKEAKWEYEKDTVALKLFRRIEKKGDHIDMVDLNNTANTVSMKVQYLGQEQEVEGRKERPMMLYQVVGDLGDVLVRVDPTMPMLIFETATRVEIYR